MKRKRKLAAAFMTALAISLAGGITVSAAEPVYTQEELTGGEEDEDGEQTFTMPVIVNATAHSEKKEDDDKGGDDGKKDEGENSGDGSTPPAQPAADAGKQTFVVTVIDRFVSRAGEDQLVSVRSIGKYQKGAYLIFYATKAKGYVVTGESVKSVTVQKDTEIMFTYTETATGSGAGAADKPKASGEKESTEEDETVSGNEVPDSEETDGDDTDEGGSENEEFRRTSVIRRPQEEPTEDTEPEVEDGPEEPKEEESFHIPWWIWLIGILILIGAVVAVLAKTGKLAYLWLLFLARFFRSKWKPWHGILTQQENRFIDVIHGGEEGGEPIQVVIERQKSPEDILAELTASDDMTYLPPGTKVSVSYHNGEDYPTVQKFSAEEETFYKALYELKGKGEVVATFFNDPAEIEFALTFRL